MKTRIPFVLIAVILLPPIRLAAAPPKKGAARPHPETPASDLANPNLMSLRLSALETLYEMQATREQMAAMQKIAAETAEPSRERKPVHLKPEMKKVMRQLHDALVAANNADKIEALEDKLEELVESQKVEFDDDVDITQAARKHASELAHSLGVSQVISLVTANEDDIQDPRAVLVEALTEGRKQKGADWNDARDSAAEEAATLMVGDSGADGLIQKFKSWLDRAHDLDDAAFKQEFADPLLSAGAVTGEVDWSQVLRNWAQYCMANLLSNPQLNDALAERLK
jgi:hypothetical protein